MMPGSLPAHIYLLALALSVSGQINVDEVKHGEGPEYYRLMVHGPDPDESASKEPQCIVPDEGIEEGGCSKPPDVQPFALLEQLMDDMTDPLSERSDLESDGCEPCEVHAAEVMAPDSIPVAPAASASDDGHAVGSAAGKRHPSGRNFDWGCIRFTFRGASGGESKPSWQVQCPYHRRSSKTTCKKSMTIDKLVTDAEFERRSATLSAVNSHWRGVRKCGFQKILFFALPVLWKEIAAITTSFCNNWETNFLVEQERRSLI